VNCNVLVLNIKTTCNLSVSKKMWNGCLRSLFFFEEMFEIIVDVTKTLISNDEEVKLRRILCDNSFFDKNSRIILHNVVAFPFKKISRLCSTDRKLMLKEMDKGRKKL